MGKERVDKLLVTLGLVETRQKAQALILAGQVYAEGQIVSKPGTLIAPNVHLKLKERLRYVSRGGLKLEKALQEFDISVKDKICLDIGASTGGFTDCLLQFGAQKVIAVDVGRGQLDWKLRSDPRVIIRETLNARYLTSESIPDPINVVTVDVSFISLTLVLPAIKGVLQSKASNVADVIALIKPQFEVGKGQVGKGGIVKDPKKHKDVVKRIRESAQRLGFCTGPVIPSPILGMEGSKLPGRVVREFGSVLAIGIFIAILGGLKIRKSTRIVSTG